MTGSFQSAAMLSASWKAPLFTTDSPMKQTLTWSPPRYLMANATPVASGMCPPTMPWPPRKSSAASNRCIEPPLPPEQSRPPPNSSAITVRALMPRASAWPWSRYVVMM